MIYKRHYLFITLLLSLAQIAVAQYKPADTLATAETRNLFNSLHKLSGTGILFGHHDDTAYGVNWRLKDSSDVKNVTGSYPAVYGWDLSGIEVDSTYDINGIPFSIQSKLVREAYERGGVNTFCWHMHNPVNGKTAWDTAGSTLNMLLPGGSFHQTYLTYLDKAAQYLGNLKGRHGEPVPILFRPFHELTGEWFWWGTATGTPDEFKELWRFTVNYLRKTKKLHNLLMVYSAADFYEDMELLERYPGDEYVDVIGFDRYCINNVTDYARHMNRQLQLLQQVATEHHKLTCIAETGYQGIPSANWWTEALGSILAQNNEISYLMIWRNHGPGHFYAPYPGQVSASDFKQFYQKSYIKFQDRITPLAVYGLWHTIRYRANAWPRINVK